MTPNRLKYRIYDKINNCYTDITYLLTQGGLIRHIDFEEGNIELLQNQDDYVVEFSIGLVDKNGEEIFEGDILKDGDDTIVVSWSNVWSKFVSSYIDGEEEYQNMDFEELEHPICNFKIIGNIYQNKDLLKE